MVRVLCAGIAIVMSVLGAGCAADVAEPDIEYVVLEVPSVALDGNDVGGAVDAPVEGGACACGDDYKCLSDWAETNFNCSVCVSVACADGHGADICTSICGPEPLHGLVDMKLER